MIIERDTDRYIVSPYDMITDVFESAYSDEQSGPLITKPYLPVTISGTVSMLIIATMCLMTYFSNGKENIWLILTIVFGLFPVIFFRKYCKQLSEYKKFNSIDNSKYVVKKEFEALFGNDLPSKMNAAEFLRIVAPLAAKPVVAKSNTFKDAVRFLVNALNLKNNPSDLLCKNVTSYGKVMPQTRHRYYIKKEDNSYVFYDQDFMNPSGEIVCDDDDIVSFGKFSSYPSSINKSGGKINPDSIIVEVNAGSEEKIYFEINGKEYDKAKKLFKGHKEMK